MTLANLKNMPNHQELEEQVTQLVTTILTKKSKLIEPDTPLLNGSNGFDSFSIMELVLHLEKTFTLCIPDQDLDPDIFYSIRTIAAYLQTRLSQDL